MSGALPSWARKGVKVVLVGHPSGKTPIHYGYVVDEAPKRGTIYTIREVTAANGAGPAGDEPGIRLSELSINGAYPDGRRFSDAWAALSSFRPLVSTKTEADDVALFHDIARQKLPEAV
jgi:hypothetical protein